MATPLETKKARRALFTGRLYDATDSDTLARVSITELTGGMDLSPAQVRELVGYLVDEQLVKRSDMGGNVSITHKGVVEVEQARSQPERPTEHFPPAAQVINIIHSTVTGSAVALGSAGATQTVSYTTEQRQDLAAVLQQIRGLLDRDVLDEDDAAVVRADVDAVEAQLASPRPNAAVVQALLGSLANVLSAVNDGRELVQTVQDALAPFLAG